MNQKVDDPVWQQTELAIEQAASHADDEVPEWRELAFDHLLAFLRLHPDATLTAPMVRVWATERGLPQPPTEMAWGAVFLRASRRGLIRRVGYTQYGNSTMHRQSISVWEPT